MRSAPSLAFDIVPSRIAQFAFALMVTLAVLSVWFSAMPIAAQWSLSAVVIAAAGYGLRTLRRPLLKRAVLQSDGVWLLALAQGSARAQKGEMAATLVSSSLLGVLTALRWRDDTTRRTVAVMLWPDSIPSSTRRQLRVWLRTGRAHASDRIDADST